MGKMTTTRLTRAVCNLIRRVGDPVIIRIDGRDHGIEPMQIGVSTVNIPGYSHPRKILFNGVWVSDCRIRIATVRALQRIADSMQTINSDCGAYGISWEPATGGFNWFSYDVFDNVRLTGYRRSHDGALCAAYEAPFASMFD